ncbi:MAG: DUF455 domain-containing protein [Sulfurospirillum sp.]|nr:MAG: DUF455 domain-containing protein [Sulfurospirillum sp.]
MEFFNRLETILTTKAPHEKIAKFKYFYTNYKNSQISYNHQYIPKHFKTPSFHEVCEIVPATTLPRRGSLSTQRGKAYLVHSVLHIEYSAIDLALDHAYRFTGMPKSYYDDWLEVADEEIRHFLMLEEIIRKLGYHYGSFPVHSFLFDVSQKSLDLVTRMAVVPRYLEASGLDSSPLVIEKLKRIGDRESREIIAALEVILEEEVDHVRKGDRWFVWACEREGIDPQNYYEIVERVLPGARKPKAYVNVASRKKAGFSCDEIRVISSQPCEE